MSNLLEWKKKMQTIYTDYAVYIEKAIRFVLALTTFLMISTKIGFMKNLANPIVSIGLAAICTFLPLNVTVILAAGLMLIHMFSLSVIIGAIAAVILLLMFIFYFRFTPKKALILLLTPIAFVLKLPVLIPIVFGFVGNPLYMIPISCGTIVFYVVKFTKEYASAMGNAGKDTMLNVAIGFAKQIVTSKEMWFAVAAAAVCLLVVYLVRKLPIDYAWIIAAVSGVVAYIAVVLVGNVAFETGVDYVPLILGSILATGIGVVLEFFVFSVDYSRTENLQFEDDEYYYYVKAVPKLSVPTKEKKVKRINKRQDMAKSNEAPVKRDVKKEKPVSRTQLTGEADIDKLIEEELMK